MKRQFRFAAILLVTCIAPAFAGMTAADVQKIVAEAKTLPVDSLRVDLKSTTAVRIVTYRLKTANDDDLKIDTVLVAKEVFAKAPEFKEVSVYFFDKQANQYRSVTVSADQVKAFATGKLSQQNLLAELTVKIESGRSAQAWTSNQDHQKHQPMDRKDVLFDLVKRMHDENGLNTEHLEALKNQIQVLYRSGRKTEAKQKLDLLERAIVNEFRRAGLPFPPELRQFKRHH